MGLTFNDGKYVANCNSEARIKPVTVHRHTLQHVTAVRKKVNRNNKKKKYKTLTFDNRNCLRLIANKT